MAGIKPKRECCLIAELAAMVRITGSIHLQEQHQLSLVMETENAAVARKIVWLLKHLFHLHLVIVAIKQPRLRKRHKFEVKIGEQDKAEMIIDRLLLKEAGRLTFHNLPTAHLNKRCCQRAFLRGCFLTGGSVTDPEKKTYHLEILPGSDELAENILYLMNLCGIKAKLGKRKKYALVYLKDGEMITKFLSLIGAHAALLQLESVRTNREMRGGINRLVNCETANLDKTVEAAMAQIRQIRSIQEKIGLDKLSPKLRELAYLRLENPEASLNELSEITQPKSTKSAINHRMRKLMQISQSLRCDGNQR